MTRWRLNVSWFRVKTGKIAPEAKYNITQGTVSTPNPNKGHKGGVASFIGCLIVASLSFALLAVLFFNYSFTEAIKETGRIKYEAEQAGQITTHEQVKAKDEAIKNTRRIGLVKAFEAEDKIEQKEFSRRGQLKDAAIFRQVKWWMPIDEVEGIEREMKDIMATPQPIPAHLSGLNIELPQIISYLGFVGHIPSSIDYQFGRKTKRLCSVIISTMLPVESTPEQIKDFMHKSGITEKLTLGAPSKKFKASSLGFDYTQWDCPRQMRISLAWKDIRINGQPQYKYVIIYCSPPEYGGDVYPLNFVQAVFDSHESATYQ